MANNGARPNSESSSFPCKRLPRYSEASSWGTGKNLGVHAATACSSDESVGDHPVYLPSSPLISAQRAWSNICAPLLVQAHMLFLLHPPVHQLVDSRLHQRCRYAMALTIFPAVVDQSSLVCDQVRPQLGQTLANLF